MGTDKKTKTTAVTQHLPEEIFYSGILTKLPVKSLYRFKCVNKQWNDTISRDQYFIKMHLSWALQTSGLSIIGLYSNPGGVAYNLPCPMSCHVFADKDGSDFFHFGTKKHTRLVGHCNGLFCFRSDSDFEFCNPYTREFLCRSLPPPPRTRRVKSYGFGFDHLKNEYKLVQIVHGSQNDNRCMVYTLGVGCNNYWEDITSISHLTTHLNHCTLPSHNETEGTLDLGKGLHINGKLYWFFRRAHRFLQFDLHHNTFECFDGPKLANGLKPSLQKSGRYFLIEWQRCVCLAFLNSSGTLLHLSYCEVHCDWKFTMFNPMQRFKRGRVGALGDDLLYIQCEQGFQVFALERKINNNGIDSKIAERFPHLRILSMTDYQFMYRVENVTSLKFYCKKMMLDQVRTFSLL